MRQATYRPIFEIDRRYDHSAGCQRASVSPPAQLPFGHVPSGQSARRLGVRLPGLVERAAYTETKLGDTIRGVECGWRFWSDTHGVGAFEALQGERGRLGWAQ